MRKCNRYRNGTRDLPGTRRTLYHLRYLGTITWQAHFHIMRVCLSSNSATGPGPTCGQLAVSLQPSNKSYHSHIADLKYERRNFLKPGKTPRNWLKGSLMLSILLINFKDFILLKFSIILWSFFWFEKFPFLIFQVCNMQNGMKGQHV